MTCSGQGNDRDTAPSRRPATEREHQPGYGGKRGKRDREKRPIAGHSVVCVHPGKFLEISALRCRRSGDSSWYRRSDAGFAACARAAPADLAALTPRADAGPDSAWTTELCCVDLIADALGEAVAACTCAASPTLAATGTRQPGVRWRPWHARLRPAPASERPAPPWPGSSPHSPAVQCPPAPNQLQATKRRPQQVQTAPPTARRAEAARSKDRRSPADRSLRASRSTRKARSDRPRRSGRRCPQPTLLHERAARHSDRPEVDERGRCTRTASGSTRSCRRSARPGEGDHYLPPARAQGCRWERRDRRRGAGRLRRGARGRTRTAAAPDRRPATSRRVHRRREAAQAQMIRTASRRTVASSLPRF